MRTTLFLILFAALLAPAAHAGGPANGYKIVVHPDNPIAKLSRDDLSKIFLKKTSSWPGGGAVTPIERPESAAVREAFCKDGLGKTLSAVKAYWQQKIFSGRDVPPQEKASDADAIAFVKANKGAVSYVAPDADTTGVKVIAVE